MRNKYIMVKKCIISVAAIVICIIVCVITNVQKKEPERIKSLVGYNAHIEVDDMTLYVVENGTCNTNKIPSIDGTKYTLPDESAKRFKELFEGQIMGETFNNEVYTYDVIFDMGARMLLVDITEGKAHYLYNKDEPIETYEFDIANEQKEFLVGLLEMYMK